MTSQSQRLSIKPLPSVSIPKVFTMEFRARLLRLSRDPGGGDTGTPEWRKLKPRKARALTRRGFLHELSDWFWWLLVCLPRTLGFRADAVSKQY